MESWEYASNCFDNEDGVSGARGTSGPQEITECFSTKQLDHNGNYIFDKTAGTLGHYASKCENPDSEENITQLTPDRASKLRQAKIKSGNIKGVFKRARDRFHTLLEDMGHLFKKQGSHDGRSLLDLPQIKSVLYMEFRQGMYTDTKYATIFKSQVGAKSF